MLRKASGVPECQDKRRKNEHPNHGLPLGKLMAEQSNGWLVHALHQPKVAIRQKNVWGGYGINSHGKQSPIAHTPDSSLEIGTRH